MQGTYLPSSYRNQGDETHLELTQTGKWGPEFSLRWLSAWSLHAHNLFNLKTLSPFGGEVPKNSLNDPWTKIASDIKNRLWDVEGNRALHDDSALYNAKFDSNGEVVLGWSFAKFMEDRVAGIPRTPSKHAYTATNKHLKRL